MNRKAFIGDLSTVIVVLFVLVVTVIIGAYTFNAVNDQFQSSDGISSEGKNITADLESRYVAVWDGIALMAFAFLSVALILSVVTLGTRPEFFFLVIIIGLFLIGVAALFANTYSAVTGSALSTVTAEFTFIPLIMQNLVNVMLFLIALLTIGLFVKIRGVV